MYFHLHLEKLFQSTKKTRFSLVPTPTGLTMIITLNSTSQSSVPALFDQMFRQRALTFKQRLGWDVTVTDGWETDAFDELDPLYVMSVTPDRTQLLGSARLLPTSGPHMMSEVFGPHFGPDATLRTPLIWEITRFCTDEAAKTTSTPSGLNFTTLELLAGVCELGMANGISHVTAVFDPLMGRIYRRAGLRTTMLGKSSSLGAGTVYAGLWELNSATQKALRDAGGLTASVLANQALGQAEVAA
jgi:acyl homoserine lactone synthase